MGGCLMRPLIDMDTIQIEITNACNLNCSNCTRMCGHIRKPFMLPLDKFKEAVDSMAGFPKMVGIMGGEPLLHPQFEELCDYALSKIGRDKLGLWTAFPVGYEKYAKVIQKTFKNVFLNDHTRSDIYHAPILVGIQEVCPSRIMWQQVDKCWVQNCWSASINPHGAYFCEIAAALSMLFGEPEVAWKVEPGWWYRIPKDFKEQMEKWCPRCGMAVPFKRRRSIEIVDDVSPLNAKALEGISRKLEAKKCVVGIPDIVKEPEQMASYKEMDYRQAIAARYGMYLTITEQGFWEPHMGEPRKTLFAQYKEKYGS